MEDLMNFKNRRVKVNFRKEIIIGSVLSVGRTRLRVLTDSGVLRQPSFAGINWIVKLDENDREIPETKVENV